jgi:DNA-binding NarL/FixJ family response regulator
MHTVLIADDHPVTREGIAKLLTDSKFDVVGMAADAQSTIQLCGELQPDLLLLDVRLGRDDGLTVLEELVNGEPPPLVVMMSSTDNPTYLARATVLGADEFILKDTPVDEWLEAMRRCLAGVESTGLAAMRNLLSADSKKKIGPLTVRESQVLVHLALGLKNGDIATHLGITYDTVKEHVQNLLRKLRLKHRTMAAVWALKHHVLK